MPLLYKKLSDKDKDMWGRFSIEEKNEKDISFILNKKLTEITEKLSQAIGIQFPKKFLIFPSISEDFDLEFAKNETNFIISLIKLIESKGFDFKQLYIYPDHPNMHITEVQRASFALQRLEENTSEIDPSIKPSIVELSQSFLGDLEIVENKSSIFPDLFFDGGESYSASFEMLKFISYFRSFLTSLDPITALIPAFRVEQSFLPCLIEAFTLEFIPSFSRNHNISERLGDAVLDVVVTSSMIKALMGKKNYFLNHQIRIAVSNKLFGIIGQQYNFTNCFIGPWDIEKLPGDCFESIAGSLYKVYGFQKVCDFWQEMLFAIPIEVAQKMDVLKAVEAMKVAVNSSSVSFEPNPEQPEYIKNLIGDSLIPPAEDKSGEFQIKNKIIGASLIKLGIVNTVISNLKCEKDAIIIQQRTSKEEINKVAEKLGFRNSKYLRVFIGGLMIQNGFTKVMEFMQTKVIPLFNIEAEMNAGKHHRHHKKTK